MIGVCPCRDKRALEDLITCLAPPPGEYEVEVEVSKNRKIIINTEGVFLRTIVVDDTLPFAKTIDKPTDIGILNRIAIGKRKDEILCITVRMLEEAARSGSLVAREKLEECRELIREIKNNCII